MRHNFIIVTFLLLFGCGTYITCSAKPLESQILKDLVGQVITDPSPNSYFPTTWSWTIKSGDISYLSFIHETDKSSYYIALMTIHLKRYQMPVDVKVVLQYQNKNSYWGLSDLQVQSITFPSQRNYASCVQIYMDYDFFPSLIVKNTCSCRLFIAGSYTDKGKQERFAVELEPNQESTIAVGPAPEKYSIHFAYRE